MSTYRDAFLHIKKLPGTFWVIVFSALINQAGNMALVFLVPYMTQRLGYSLVDATIAFAVFAGSMSVFGVLGGHLIERLGAARWMVATLLINGVILLTFPMVHFYGAILILCILWGMSWGIYRPAAQTLVSYLSTAGFHKVTFSVFRLANNLGMSIGPAVGGYLAAHSFASIFVVNGIAYLLAGVALIVGLLGSAWFSYRPAAEQKVFTLHWLKHDKALRIFLLGIIPVSMVFFQHEATLPVYLKENLNFPLSFYGWLFTLNTLMIVFLELLINIATIHWSYRVNFILGSLFITIGFAGIYFATSMWGIMLLAATWTMGEMILFPATSSYIVDVAPEKDRGSYMSLCNACYNIGLLLGPLTGAFIMQQLGAGMLWIACGILGMISVALFVFLTEPKDVAA